jgi:hypothetical protein
MEPTPRPNDEAFATVTHNRWRRRRLRNMDDPAYRDEWYAEQCGGCRFWIALTGVLGGDYGACANPASVRDGFVQFEHDGRDAFAPAPNDEWGGEPP